MRTTLWPTAVDAQRQLLATLLHEPLGAVAARLRDLASAAAPHAPPAAIQQSQKSTSVAGGEIGPPVASMAVLQRGQAVSVAGPITALDSDPPRWRVDTGQCVDASPLVVMDPVGDAGYLR